MPARLSLCLCAAVAVSGGVEAAAENPADPTPATTRVEQIVDSPLQPAVDYSNASDQELTRLGARWEELSKAERDALLKEVKLRMARRKDSDGVLMIRTQRRYGRVYGGGQYLKIETKVVRITPAQPDGSRTGNGFGVVGYEQRSAHQSPADDASSLDAPDPEADQGVFDPPVVRVTDVTP